MKKTKDIRVLLSGRALYIVLKVIGTFGMEEYGVPVIVTDEEGEGSKAYMVFDNYEAALDASKMIAEDDESLFYDVGTILPDDEIYNLENVSVTGVGSGVQGFLYNPYARAEKHFFIDFKSILKEGVYGAKFPIINGANPEITELMFMVTDSDRKAGRRAQIERTLEAIYRDVTQMDKEKQVEHLSLTLTLYEQGIFAQHLKTVKGSKSVEISNLIAAFMKMQEKGILFCSSGLLNDEIEAHYIGEEAVEELKRSACDDTVFTLTEFIDFLKHADDVPVKIIIGNKAFFEFEQSDLIETWERFAEINGEE